MTTTPTPEESSAPQSKTPSTDGDDRNYPLPEHAQHIQFEGCDCVVMAPEAYEELFNKSRQLETELAEAIKEIGLLKSKLGCAQEERWHLESVDSENEQLRSQVERLVDAMNELMDWAGVPDESYSLERWNKAMDKCREVIESTKPSAGGEG